MTLTDEGQDGSRAIREAISLAPENSNVKAAFEKIQKDDQEHILKKLCRKLVSEDDEAAGTEAIQYLGSSAEVPANVARECMELITRPRNLKIREIQDDVLASLLRESVAAKAFLAKTLHECKDDHIFEEIYCLGDGAASGIAAVVLDTSSWSSESIREACERDIFQLYLAKLLEVGDDHNGRALKSIARLMAADAEKLHEYIDKDCFDLILCCLDGRNSDELRSQATLATAKYLEASGDVGQQTLAQFVESKISRQYNEDLVLAFSAAAGVFPVASSTASALFLTKGFLRSLMPVLVKKIKSGKVVQAALEMLSAACMDKQCREAIRQDCTIWLRQVVEECDSTKSGLAALVLIKLRDPSNQNGGTESRNRNIPLEVDDLVPRLQQLMANEADESKRISIEGLAYASIHPKVRNRLAKDKAFLESLLQILKVSLPRSPIIFGGLTLLNNLTRFLPNLSEEQKRLLQLAGYANASKATPKADPLEEGSAVTERCIAVINAGAVSILAGLARGLSPASIAIVFEIMLSISRVSKSRGSIAQQGGVRLLLQNYTAITGTSPNEARSRRTAAHALALILISIHPSLLFRSAGPSNLTLSIRLLLSLLTEDPALASEGPRNLLPTFESLLALTNLATVPSGEPSEMIIRQSWGVIEDLLLSSNTLIQRAATQLTCNLVACAKGVELFADESTSATRRLHILLAMADHEDEETEKAAGGALASLTQFEGVVKEILKRATGVRVLLGLCTEDDLEIVHRGVVCIMNIVSLEGTIGRQAKDKVREHGGVELFQDEFPMIEYLDPAILQITKGILSMLQ